MEKRNAYRILMEKPEGERPLEDLYVGTHLREIAGLG
jgi:hypothetical protein